MKVIVNNQDRLSHKFGNEKARVQINDIFRWPMLRSMEPYIYLNLIFVQSLIFADRSKTMVLEEQLS